MFLSNNCITSNVKEWPRVLIGLDRPGDPGFRFRHDLIALISCGEQDANPHGLSRNGIALLWPKAWDGVKTLDFYDLHPLCIEICRRIRLGFPNGKVFAPINPSWARRKIFVFGFAVFLISFNGSGAVEDLTARLPAAGPLHALDRDLDHL
jgi:hypothetical protein